MSGPSRKRISNESSKNLTSIVKKVILEELSDNSDILNSLAQYNKHIKAMQDAQDKALVNMTLLYSQILSKPIEDPLVLEIVRPDEQEGAAGLDRRKFKIRKASMSPAINSQKMQNIQNNIVQDIKVIKNENLVNESEAGNSEPEMVKTKQEREQVECPPDNHNQEEANGYIPIFGNPTTDSEDGQNNQAVSLEGYDQSEMIEIQDEDHNQIILPSELQQPILDLLSTRGANLRKITFTHNDVVQTIEIVQPDANLSGDEGTHLILTPQAMTQDQQS